MVQSLLGFNKDTYPLSPNLGSIFMGTDRAFIGPKDGSTSHTDAGIDHLKKIDSSRINPTGQLKHKKQIICSSEKESKNGHQGIKEDDGA
ncbi:hypothetical protein PtB15_14B428 [Puccinia triticina]|nr:hypothetical protein PtB15_14B428 [Puccinia triticina]